MPILYIAAILFPRVPVPGAAIKPDEMVYRGKGFRAKKNQNRQTPGKLNLKATPFTKPNRIFNTIEDYDIESTIYWVDAPVMNAQLETMDRFGIMNYEEDIVQPQLISALLNERESRVSDVLVAGNFGFVIDGSAGDGYWDDDAVDPIKQVQNAILSIEQKGGTWEEGQMYAFVFSQDAFNAFINNANVRARFGDASAPATPEDILNLLKNTIMAGYPPEVQGSFTIRIAKATGTDANLGQNADPEYFIKNKAVLIRTIKGIDGNAGDGLRKRAWAKGYSLLDVMISAYEDDGEEATYYRAKHAYGDQIYDETLGALWTDIVRVAA